MTTTKKNNNNKTTKTTTKPTKTTTTKPLNNQKYINNNAMQRKDPSHRINKAEYSASDTTAGGRLPRTRHGQTRGHKDGEPKPHIEMRGHI